MTLQLARATRLLLTAEFALLALIVLALGVGARLAPGLGYELFAVRTASMEPAVPVGSLTIVWTRTGDIPVGQAIAFRVPNGTVVTHRVVEVVATPEGRFLRTRGDANERPDPALVPMSALVGPVRASVPLLGIMLALLRRPMGVVTILAIAGSLLTAIWLLEEFELQLEEEPIPRIGRAPAQRTAF